MSSEGDTREGHIYMVTVSVGDVDALTPEAAAESIIEWIQSFPSAIYVQVYDQSTAESCVIEVTSGAERERRRKMN